MAVAKYNEIIRARELIADELLSELGRTLIVNAEFYTLVEKRLQTFIMSGVDLVDLEAEQPKWKQKYAK